MENNGELKVELPPLTNVAELYSRLEAEGRQKATQDNKSERIRQVVREVAIAMGTKKLLLSAVYAIAKEKISPNLERSYFANTIERTWHTVRENNRVWIDMDREKQKGR